MGASPNDDTEVVDVDEVLAPDAPVPPREGEAPTKGAKRAVRGMFPRVMARLLDECISLPNGKFKFGLDPIIGFFFPFVGDVTTAALGTTILVEGLRRQVPKPVIMRMSTNLLLNAAIGAVPVVGDLFSLWYKSNLRNYALLERHSGNPDHPRVKVSMWPVVIFLLGLIALVSLVFFGLWALVRVLFY